MNSLLCVLPADSENNLMNNWIEIVSLEEIPKLGSRVVKTDTVDIAIFRTQNDDVFAVKDSCPHKGGPLSQGIVHDSAVTCPLHNWKIDLTSGEVMGPDEGCVKRYSVKVEDGKVFLGLGE